MKPVSKASKVQNNYFRNDTIYTLALQYERYDLAIIECIRALRRCQDLDTWRLRLHGCLARRHHHA